MSPVNDSEFIGGERESTSTSTKKIVDGTTDWPAEILPASEKGFRIHVGRLEELIDGEWQLEAEPLLHAVVQEQHRQRCIIWEAETENESDQHNNSNNNDSKSRSPGTDFSPTTKRKLSRFFFTRRDFQHK